MGWNRAPYTEDELITLMKEKAKELGRTPTETEFKQFQTAIKYFGTWSEFQYAAGLKITYLRDLPDKKNYIIGEIRQLAQNLGRTPYIREYGRADQAKKLFGSWNNAVKVANLKVNKKLQPL